MSGEPPRRRRRPPARCPAAHAWGWWCRDGFHRPYGSSEPAGGLPGKRRLEKISVPLAGRRRSSVMDGKVGRVILLSDHYPDAKAVAGLGCR